MILPVIVLQTCVDFQYANYFCLHISIACACCFKFGSASTLDQDKNTKIRNLTELESTSLGQCSISMLLCHCDICLCWDNVADVFKFFQVFSTRSLTFPFLFACACCLEMDPGQGQNNPKVEGDVQKIEVSYRP
jgi:hypothetical protein